MVALTSYTQLITFLKLKLKCVTTIRFVKLVVYYEIYTLTYISSQCQ